MKEVEQIERLTERYKDSIANTILIRGCGDKLCKDICNDIEYDCSKCGLEEVFEKLAEYEDLEEQGLLLKLPCKVGDKLYIVGEYITECFVDEICIKESGITITCVEYCKFENGVRHIYGNVKLKYGKSSNFFFTLEEAEKKLEEMRNAENA